jgi:hypothetical protein
MSNPETSPQEPQHALFSADPRAILTCEVQKATGNLRVTYAGWDEAKVFRPGESIEVLVAGGQVKAYRRGAPLPGPAPDPYRDWDGL